MPHSLKILFSRFSSIAADGQSQNQRSSWINASFHHSERVKQLCSEAGVKLLYLPPYSPDFNPIEEYFAELKAYCTSRKIGQHMRSIVIKVSNPSFAMR
jgi:transposase